MSDLDLAMLDASEWQEAHAEPARRELSRSRWTDRDGGFLGRFYRDTGARSSDRSEWLEARRSGIGASEAAMLMGESRWGDAGTLYARKLTEPTEADDEWLTWGLALEQVIADAYASPRYAGRAVVRDGRLLRSLAHPWAVCTLDAWICSKAGEIPLELKADSDRYGYAWAEGLPREYEWQLQHQMMVTGTPRASIACLLAGSRLVWADAERDETMIRRLIRAGESLWAQIESGEMPETTDHRALATVFDREERGRVIELEGIEWARADLMRCEADAAYQRASVERAAIDARIKRAMGRAEVARLDDGTEYRWKTQRDGRRVLRRREARIR
mgnify:FL=1